MASSDPKDIVKIDQKSLENRNPLSEIKLSEEKLDELLLETIGEASLESIPIAGKLISYVQKYKEKLDKARTAIFLETYKKHSESQDEFNDSLRRLLTSNAGLILFQKTIRILNKDSYDSNYIDLLATSLKNISDKDFEKLFDEIDYVLSQIEKLSPQALLILSKFESWQKCSLDRATSMSGQIIVGDWDMQVATFFASNNPGTYDENAKERIAHAFRELENIRLVTLTEDRHVGLTPIGTEVYTQISKRLT